jgi:glycosyltransferase involved in cell wall biosynthesis
MSLTRYANLPQRVALLSFEGPDRYSMIGGLGVRTTELARALDEAGIATDVFFIGDPDLEPVERKGERLTLRRWCQWISAYHPADVYDGEAGKIADYTSSVPSFIIDRMQSGFFDDERLLVLAEDWQVAGAVIELDRLARERGIRDRLTMAWNANNTYGFHTIDFPALSRAAHLTCVSRYMKFEVGLHGAQALVIPNGIPERIFGEANIADAAYIRRMLDGRRLLLKVGRFDPDKRWMQAIDAVGDVRASGPPVQLFVRGGKEAYGEAVFARARERGLTIEDVSFDVPTVESLAQALARSSADIVNIRSFLPDALLFTLYGAVDAVLANSGKEPFGLVGLEVMASGGVAVCGSTGEDYAAAFENAIVCDTGDPRELASYLERLWSDRGMRERIVERARATARTYTWPNVLDVLDAKVGYMNAQA